MNTKQIIGIVLPILFIISFMTTYRKHILNFSQTVLCKLIFVCIILFYAEMDLMYGFLALVFIVFYYKIFFPLNNYIIQRNKAIISPAIKESDDLNLVPFIIYQTWHSKELPPKMSACVEKLKKDNPEFEHHLYDDEDCRAFIKENYDSSVLQAYDSLVPGAYKADLWRYCVIYKTGGVYLDIKFQCEPGFSLKELTKDYETFILDRPYGDLTMPIDVNLSILNSPTFYENLPKYTDGTWENKQIGLYNAVIASASGNPVLYECIQQVVKNVKNKIYGYNPLYPTGPGLFGELYFKGDYENKVKKIKYFNSIAGTFIVDKNRKVLSHYPEYRTEQRTYTPKGPIFYYSDLWYNQKVYGIITK